MFGKKNEDDELLNFDSKNYKIKDRYNSNNLVIANLEYISNEVTSLGPMVNKTTQKYIFEVINKNGKNRYREIFTGFIASDEESCYFNLPYVVDIVSLKEQVPSVTEIIPKYGLLLLLNEVNNEKIKKLK